MATMEMFRRDDNARAFEAGQTIAKEGDAGDVMYVLVEGEIDLSVRGIVVETLAVAARVVGVAFVAEREIEVAVRAEMDVAAVVVGRLVEHGQDR